MKKLLTICFLLLVFIGQTQRIDDYFEQVRGNEAKLTAFIAQMPKGGDLHNHYTGAIYAETYWRWMVEGNYCLNTRTLQMASPAANGTCDSDFTSLSALNKSGELNKYRDLVIRYWSTKDYDQVHSDTRENQFFTSFGKFGMAGDLNYDQGLNELKNRAKKENVSYIELMFKRVPLLRSDSTAAILYNADTINYYNTRLIELGQQRDRAGLPAILNRLYSLIEAVPIKKSANAFIHYMDSLHTTLQLDEPEFTIRYLTYITRVQNPVTVFISLLASCEAANNSPLITGVNIVAPEDDPVSMRDYWLHMQLFAWCHQLYPAVKYTMHAGELTEGMVPPEELTWHISSAVLDAGAKRIGHGVDIAYEKNSYELLRYMNKNEVDVEINLSSNEFILGVANDRHPILLYNQFNVPITISTDDPGISRTSLTEQFVLLAKRYKEVTYRDIKKYVYNSIKYSFIKEPKVKETLIKGLDDRFIRFEKYIMEKKP